MRVCGDGYPESEICHRPPLPIRKSAINDHDKFFTHKHHSFRTSRRSRTADHPEASANRHVFINIPRENPEEWPPRCPHTLKHENGTKGWWTPHRTFETSQGARSPMTTETKSGLPVTHGLRVFDALEPKFTPLQVCPVRVVDPLNGLVRGVFTL